MRTGADDWITVRPVDPSIRDCWKRKYRLNEADASVFAIAPWNCEIRARYLSKKKVEGTWCKDSRA